MLRFSEATRCRHLRYQGRAQNSTGVSAVVPTEPTYDRLHGRAMVSWVVSRRSSCQQPVPVPTMPSPRSFRCLHDREPRKDSQGSPGLPGLEVLCVFGRTWCRPHTVIKLFRLHKYMEVGSMVTRNNTARLLCLQASFTRGNILCWQVRKSLSPQWPRGRLYVDES